MRSTRKLIGTAVLAAASLLPAAPGLAQERSPDVTQEPSSEAAQERSPDATQVESQAAPLSPFGPTEIADSALATGALLREASRTVDATTGLAEISDAIPGVSGRIDNLERDTRGRMQGDGPGFALEQTEHAWQRVLGQLDGWLGTLSSNATAVGSLLDQIDAGRRRWEMTRDSTRAGEVPAEVTREIGQTLAAVDSVQGLVRVARDTVLKLQAAVGLQKARADQNLADLRQEISSRRGRLLRIDSPPLWKAFDRPGVRRSLSERTAAVWQLNYRSVSSFLAEQEGRLLGDLAFLLILILILARLRDVAGTQLEQDDCCHGS